MLSPSRLTLEQALGDPKILDEVGDCLKGFRVETVAGTVRAVGKRCSCNTPVLVLITVRCRPVLTVLRASIASGRCEDCSAAMSPKTVTYAGIFSPGWPAIPATVVSRADLYHWLELLEGSR